MASLSAAGYWTPRRPDLGGSRLRGRALLLGVFRPRLAQHPQDRAALLAEAHLGAVGLVAPAVADAAAATRAIELHVGGVDRHLLGEPAALRVAAVGLDVLVDAVDAFDHDLALFRQDAQHLPRPPVG